MKILVTGYRGFIGSHLDIARVIGIDKKDNHDILDCELPDTDVVIHLAAETSVINSVKEPFKDAQTNILGTIRLAERYKHARFIYASSGGAIQETVESPYGLSKLTGEDYVKMICDDYVILRFPNIYGPGSKSVVDKFINQQVLNIYGDGSSTRDYVYVEDLVRAIEASINWKKGMYSLGAGKSISVLELAQATGKEYKFSDKVPGELQYSKVPNTSPWQPKQDVIKYIKSHV